MVARRVTRRLPKHNNLSAAIKKFFSKNLPDGLWFLSKGIAIPAGIVFFIGMGSYWLFTQVLSDTPILPPENDVFKDVLQTVIAIAAIAIGATGLGVYKLLAQQIEEKVNRSVGKELKLAIVAHKIDLGKVYWHFFLRSTSESERDFYIGEAISETKKASSQGLEELDENDPDVEPYVIQFRNNLAYFIYEKYRIYEIYSLPAPQYTATERHSERQLALMSIEYLDNRKGKYPDLNPIHEMDDTISKVRNLFS